MKSFINSFITFILFAILFYFIFVFIWSEIAPSFLKPNVFYPERLTGHLNSRLIEVKKINNVDILFIGSSQAYRGFDPRIFENVGIKTFNLGSSSQTPIQTKVLLMRYLESLSPKIVIYEVTPGIFSNDGIESSLDLIANDKIDILSIEMAAQLGNIKTSNTLIYRLFRDIFRLNGKYIEANKKGEDLYIAGGFVEKELSFYSVEEQPKKELFLNEDQIDAFEEILANIKSINADLYLVEAPVSNSFYSSYSNHSLFDSIISTYGSYHDFNRSMVLDDSLHFYDSNHLNQNGVVIFNNNLIETLRLKEKIEIYSKKDE